MQVMKRNLLPAVILLGISCGFFLGQRTFTYYAFFISAPMIFPCPYTLDGHTIACSYHWYAPTPDLAVRWRGWPQEEGVPTFPPSSGSWLRDFLFFDPDRLPD